LNSCRVVCLKIKQILVSCDNRIQTQVFAEGSLDPANETS